MDKTFKLHYNKSNGIFTVRKTDRSTFCASGRHEEIPILGSTIRVARGRHIIITKDTFKEAVAKRRPVLSVAKTHFPLVRLLFRRLKEIIL